MPDLAITALVVFACGALYEAACVGWVHHSERGRPISTACFSMLAATAEVSGVFNSVRDIRVAPFFILGYGVGTYCAVRWKGGRS